MIYVTVLLKPYFSVKILHSFTVETLDVLCYVNEHAIIFKDGNQGFFFGKFN